MILFATLLGAQPASGEVDAAAGARKFHASICVQCHGQNAQGVPGMGMDLREAPLVRAAQPEAVAAFIARGHRGTNEFPGGMPANGGTSLTQQDRENIAAWLVTLPKSGSNH